METAFSNLHISPMNVSLYQEKDGRFYLSITRLPLTFQPCFWILLLLRYIKFLIIPDVIVWKLRNSTTNYHILTLQIILAVITYNSMKLPTHIV